MQRSLLAMAFFLGISTFVSPALGTEQPSQKCDVGPLVKTYGKTPWNVYSCNNDTKEGNTRVVIVTAPGNPAMPYVFFFYVKDGGYRLHGEGTGDKKITDAAVSDLQQLAESDIEALIKQTRQIREKDEKSGDK